MIALIALVALVCVVLPWLVASDILMFSVFADAANATDLVAFRRRGCRNGYCCCFGVADCVFLRMLL